MTNTSAPDSVRRRRRKEARPAEIVAAAIEVFAEAGFGRAKLEDVARRAGVAKGTLFVYFPTKQDLFRAVARSLLSTNLALLQSAVVDPDMPLSEFAPLVLAQAAIIAETPMAPVIRLLIAEARTFPDIAQVWYDEVLAKMLGILTSAIERAQAKGEVRAGDAGLYAFSIIGPMLAGVVFREIFQHTDAEIPDLQQLARQHATAILNGLLVR